MSDAAKIMRRVTAAIKAVGLDRSAILATARDIRAKARAEFKAGKHAEAERLHMEAACYERCALQCTA